MGTCPSDNTQAVDQSTFFGGHNTINWDAHRIGWAVAGGCTIIVNPLHFPDARSMHIIEHTDYTDNHRKCPIALPVGFVADYAVCSLSSYIYSNYTNPRHQRQM
jgi:hypothetical protein